MKGDMLFYLQSVIRIQDSRSTIHKQLTYIHLQNNFLTTTTRELESECT